MLSLIMIHETHYYASLNKSIIPFAIIHSDVWGPFLRTTISSYHCFIYLLMITLE